VALGWSVNRFRPPVTPSRRECRARPNATIDCRPRPRGLSSSPASPTPHQIEAEDQNEAASTFSPSRRRPPGQHAQARFASRPRSGNCYAAHCPSPSNRVGAVEDRVAQEDRPPPVHRQYAASVSEVAT
jgi:hypothetical protein